MSDHTTPQPPGPDPRSSGGAAPSATPSRRQVLEVVAAAGLAMSAGSFNPVASGRGPAPPLGPVLPKLRAMRDTIRGPARARALAVAAGGLARPAETASDRYTLAIDVAQLLWCFAIERDTEPYLALRDFAVRQLIVDNKDDAFTKGFVLWRCKPGGRPDATGTTEALRLAKGLWTGAAAFGRPEDRDLALTVIEGYGRHQNVDQGLWLIRNYFHFDSRSFATNSFIIDYDPDFLRQVADAHKPDSGTPGASKSAGDAGGNSNAGRYKALADLADHSYEVLRSAVAPCGLLYDLLQPELKTMYFELDVAYFSPNDIIQTNNACATAATVARGAPEVALGVLRFLSDRMDFDRQNQIYAHYYGRTGEKVHARRLGATDYCAVVRLAALMGDRALLARCVEQAMMFWEHAVAHADTIDAWTAGEMLLGLQAVLDAKA